MRQLKITKSITNRESNSLDRYFQDIYHERLLSIEEEIDLAQKIKKGGLALPDLINEGNLGLIKAAKKFDETRGFKFISYAVWWIRQSILQAIAEQSRLVRLPLNQVGSATRINRVLNKFEQENLRRPSIGEIAENTNMSEKKIADAMKANAYHLSVDAPIIEGEENSLLDTLQNKDLPDTDRKVVDEGLVKEVKETLLILSERERQVVESFFGINQREMSLDEIADKYGLTRERVRQIKENAIKQIRKNTHCKELKAYLGR